MCLDNSIRNMLGDVVFDDSDEIAVEQVYLEIDLKNQ